VGGQGACIHLGAAVSLKLVEKALDPPQRDLLRDLGGILGKHNFYLAGGTAVALLFGHRKSVDLDWFVADPFDFQDALVQELRDHGFEVERVRVDVETLHAVIRGGSGPFSGLSLSASRAFGAARRLGFSRGRGRRSGMHEIGRRRSKRGQEGLSGPSRLVSKLETPSHHPTALFP